MRTGGDDERQAWESDGGVESMSVLRMARLGNGRFVIKIEQ